VLHHQRSDRQDLDHLIAHEWLKARPITRWRFGGVSRAAADPLPQLDPICNQGDELTAEIMGLMVRGKDKCSGLGRPRKPSRFWNPGKRSVRRRPFLPEMQPEIKLPSRVQQAGCPQ
jgi:hypothetical protein